MNSNTIKNSEKSIWFEIMNNLSLIPETMSEKSVMDL